MYVHVYHSMCVETTCGSWFLPSTMWVPGDQTQAVRGLVGSPLSTLLTQILSYTCILCDYIKYYLQ